MSAVPLRKTAQSVAFMRTVMLASPVALMLFSLPASANDDPTPVAASKTYDIPAQPLDAALSRYAEVSGVDVLLDEPEAAGRRSSPVVGRFAAPQALRLLLEGTGLVARFTSRNSAIITPVQAAGRPLVPARDTGGTVITLDMMHVTAPRVIGSAQPAIDRRFLMQLASGIRAQLVTAKLIDRAAKPRMRLQTRIRADGTLFDVRVAIPSTSAERDARIVATLDGLRLDLTPPEGLRQPVLFDIDGR